MCKKFSGMILAAGFGKRLLPLTKSLPKPLVSINGITLLDNSINFLKKLGCDDIVINTHYMSNKIFDHIDKRLDKKIITTIYENKILDTGGGIKNATPYFTNKDIMITNSDIFWRDINIEDGFDLINNYYRHQNPHLLLVKKNNIFGLNKLGGDFILNKNKIIRYKSGNEIIYYSGLQMIKSNIFSKFSKNIFSLNDVWDYLIKDKILCGQVMKSDLYHVGDIQGLTKAKELDS